jgi:hypothetical protein
LFVFPFIYYLFVYFLFISSFFIYLPIIYLFRFFIYLFIIFIYLFVYLCFYLFIVLFIFIIYLFVYLFVLFIYYLFVYFFIYFFVFIYLLFICSFLCLFISLFFSLYLNYLFIHACRRVILFTHTNIIQYVTMYWLQSPNQTLHVFKMLLSKLHIPVQQELRRPSPQRSTCNNSSQHTSTLTARFPVAFICPASSVQRHRQMESNLTQLSVHPELRERV